MTTSPHVHPVTAHSFDADVLGAAVPVLVDFTATWCGPCRALAPILARIAEEGAERLKVVTLDADEHPSISARYGVRGLPTVIAFVGGKEIARHIGVASKEKLLRLLEARAA